MGAKYDFSFASFFRCCVSRHLLENSKYFFKDILILCFYVNLIQDESFWDCLRMKGGQKGPFSNLSHISCNDETWQSYSLPKEKPKNHVTHPLNSADISIFSPEISKFCYIKKYRYRLHFGS